MWNGRYLVTLLSRFRPFLADLSASRSLKWDLLISLPLVSFDWPFVALNH